MPTTLGPSTDYTGAGVTQGGKKTFIAAMRALIADRLGTVSGIAPEAVATAANIALGALTSKQITLTGSVQVNTVTVPVGSVFTVKAAAAVLLKAAVTGTGADIAILAGDSFTWRATAADTLELINLVRAGSYPASGPGLVMPGFIADWGGITLPAGYLACPGSLTNISRTTYAALFAAIGTQWGAGDGVTTFGLPYFPTGYVALANTSSGTGATTVGAIQDHSHPIAAPNAATSVGGTVNGNTGNTGAIQSVTGTNFAAGMYVLKCVKY